MADNIFDMIKGAFVGGAIGDALGFITERAWTKKNLQIRASTPKITFFVPWKKIRRNRYFSQIIPMEKGSYSDDTQLLLSVSRSIIYDKLPLFDERYFKNELDEWLIYQRGGGRAVKAAANNLNCQFHEGYTWAGGNGALMRALPHVVSNLKRGDMDNAIKNAIRDTLITHGHPKAIISEVFFIKLMYEIFLNKSVFESKELAKEYIKKFSLFSLDFVPRDWFKKWEQIEKTEYTKVESKEIKEFLESLEWIDSNLEIEEKVAYEKLKACGKYAGSATATLLASIFTLEKNEKRNFRDTILIPVNILCCDTDTLAELVGIVKGAVVGIDSIDNDLKRDLKDFDYIQKLGIELLEGRSVKSITNHKEIKLSTIKNKISNGILNVGDEINSKIFSKGIIEKIEDAGETFKQAKISFNMGQSIFLLFKNKNAF